MCDDLILTIYTKMTQEYDYHQNSEWDKSVYDTRWYDKRWFGKDAIHSNWTLYDNQGYDMQWYNNRWFNKEWLHKNWTPYDHKGYDIVGYNAKWFNIAWMHTNSTRFDRWWYDAKWYDNRWFIINWLHKNWTRFDNEGYDIQGYDIQGYNNQGYDLKWYDKLWFNIDWIHINWTRFDRWWYDVEWYNNRWWYDVKGYNKEWFDKLWFNIDWYYKLLFNIDWYDKLWFNIDRLHKNWTRFDNEGYDIQWFDNQGYDIQWYNSKWFNIDWIHINWTRFDRWWYDVEWYNNRWWYDVKGYNKEWFDKQGYDTEGFDNQGYDIKGYDKQWFDNQGYDAEGYDRIWYNHNWYDNGGYNNRWYNHRWFNSLWFCEDWSLYDAKLRDSNWKHIESFYPSDLSKNIPNSLIGKKFWYGEEKIESIVDGQINIDYVLYIQNIQWKLVKKKRPLDKYANDPIVIILDKIIIYLENNDNELALEIIHDNSQILESTQKEYNYCEKFSAPYQGWIIVDFSVLQREFKERKEMVERKSSNHNLDVRNIQKLKYAYILEQAHWDIQKEKEIIVYSHRMLGRENPPYTLTENIKVQIKTNFWYGSKSYFRTLLTYKDIDIILYSDRINYYDWEFSQLLEGTFSYESFNQNWDQAITDMINFSNYALEYGEDQFIEHYIIGQINWFITWLYRILNTDVKTTDKNQLFEVNQYRQLIMEHKFFKIVNALDAIGKISKLPEIIQKKVNVDRIKDIYLDVKEQARLYLDKLKNDRESIIQEWKENKNNYNYREKQKDHYRASRSILSQKKSISVQIWWVKKEIMSLNQQNKETIDIFKNYFNLNRYYQDKYRIIYTSITQIQDLLDRSPF